MNSASATFHSTEVLPTSLSKLVTDFKKQNIDRDVSTARDLNRLFDVNFLRKEHMYTKLKYSRCPQYDIVSGGVAALFAGYLGFLVGEKFGLELLDSGDFYFALMYVVFFCLAGKLLFKVLDEQTSLREVANLS